MSPRARTLRPSAERLAGRVVSGSTHLKNAWESMHVSALQLQAAVLEAERQLVASCRPFQHLMFGCHTPPAPRVMIVKASVRCVTRREEFT